MNSASPLSRKSRTNSAVEHPRRDDDAALVRACTDEDLLTSSFLAVEDRDLSVLCGVPRIADLRVKHDMGRMT